MNVVNAVFSASGITNTIGPSFLSPQAPNRSGIFFGNSEYGVWRRHQPDFAFQKIFDDRSSTATRVALAQTPEERLILDREGSLGHFLSNPRRGKWLILFLER
jgi:hypothetical protein